MRSSVSKLLAIALWANVATPAFGEYGDVVIQNYAEPGGYGAVVFSHSFHRLLFRCNVCHEDLAIEMKAGANDITMAKIIDGEFCGGCHNGETASAPVVCTSCHKDAPSASE